MFRWVLHKLKGDKIIWILTILIALTSVLAVYSASSAMAFRIKGGDAEFFVLKHVILVVIGLLTMYVVHLLDYRIFARLTNLLLIVTIPLLVYTIIQGAELNEAARWITVFGQSFQPSDLAKLTLMIYLAKLLTQRQDVIKDFTEGFLPALFWVTIICGLIAPSDLSTASLMFIASMMVMFVAGVDMKYLGLLTVIGVMGLMILIPTAKRSSTWENRWEDYAKRMTQSEYDGDYQTVQSHIAIATGGIIGKGVGKSSQRNFLPSANSDYIYSIIVEEYGLLGGMVVIIFFLFLLFRSVSIVTVSKTFGALLACGLSFLLVLQAIMHMGVAVGILPSTGLTLPIISTGGTSIIMTCVTLGMILSVSRDAMEKKKEKNNSKGWMQRIIRA